MHYFLYNMKKLQVVMIIGYKLLLIIKKCDKKFLGNDSPNVMPNGLAEIILGSKLTIIEFREMIHGWTIRGGKLGIFIIDLQALVGICVTIKNSKNVFRYFRTSN